jgi:uncharacterized protein YigA (DUF484 family)
LLDPTETDLRALMSNLHLHAQLEDTPAKVQHGMASMMRHAAVAASVFRRNVALAAIDLHRTAAERLAAAELSSPSDLVPPKHKSAIQVNDQTPQIVQAQRRSERDGCLIQPTSHDARSFSSLFSLLSRRLRPSVSSVSRWSSSNWSDKNVSVGLSHDPGA